VRLPRLTALIPLLFAPVTAAAQTAGPASHDPDQDRDIVTVGIAAGFMGDYEGAKHHSLTPIPGAIGTAGGHDFAIIGNRASFNLIRTPDGPVWSVQAGPLVAVNFNRAARGQIDNPQVRALPKRDVTVEAGGYLGITKTGVLTSRHDRLSLSVSYRHDIFGVHGSAIVTPNLQYFTPLSRRTAVVAFVSADHVGNGYMASYFNITPADSVASGLRVYDGRGGWKNWTVGMAGTVALSGDLLHGWKLVGGATYSRLIGDAAASPVVRDVGSANQWLGAVGIAYTF